MGRISLYKCLVNNAMVDKNLHYAFTGGEIITGNYKKVDYSEAKKTILNLEGGIN